MKNSTNIFAEYRNIAFSTTKEAWKSHFYYGLVIAIFFLIFYPIFLIWVAFGNSTDVGGIDEQSDCL